MSEFLNDAVEKEIIDDECKDRLVPVSESIRYRKRAQSAEMKLMEIEDTMKLANQHNKELNDKIKEYEVQNSIIIELSKAGVKDMESGIALVRSRMQNGTRDNIDELVTELKSEKQFLFGGINSRAADKTAGVKNLAPETEKILAQAAKRAAASGSRRDIQEYLKLRRNFL